MKLTDEDIRRHKENIYSVECVRGKVKMSDGDIIHNLCDTIEALRLENAEWQKNYDELDAGHSKLFKEFCEAKRENEQLQAQVAQYREALIIANHRMPDVGQFCACGNCKICGATISYAGYEYCISCARKIVDEALSSTSVAYHNPADAAALKQAMEALELILKKHTDIPNHNRYPSSTSICRKAIAAIVEVLGE